MAGAVQSSLKFLANLDEPLVYIPSKGGGDETEHVGNFVPLMMLRRFQTAGHRPIALAGGATGMIGDPSGKSDERTLLSAQQIESNLNLPFLIQKKSIKQLISCDNAIFTRFFCICRKLFEDGLRFFPFSCTH